MKYIYIWDCNKQQYQVRFATHEEEENIKQAIKLFNDCKQTYRQIINDAWREYNGDIDRFIDDEAYYAVQELHKNLDKVNELTKGLINLNTTKYTFMCW